MPGKEDLYKNVKVSGLGLASLLQTAGQAKRPGIAMVNGLIDLLFSREELKDSSGQGLRGNKDKALNQDKVSALKG